MWLRWTMSWLIGMWAASLAAQDIQFTDVTHDAGLTEPFQGLLGHGAAWGDFDRDGRVDLYVGGFSDRPDSDYKPATGPVGNRLLRNMGGGRFERASLPAVEIHGRTSGAVFADLDNDGDLDLYVANNAKMRLRPKAADAARESVQASAKYLSSRLFRNDGGKLVDISADSGACPVDLHTARNVGVFDYNGDGLLDLLVIEDRFTRRPRSVLLKNLGGMKFADANAEAGLPDNLFGLGLAVADVNGDRRPDFFVGHSNRFFISHSDGKYREPQPLQKMFAWQPLDGEDWPCGAAFGDLNRDGRLDLVLAIHGVRARNRVYINEGMFENVPRFRDATREVGLPSEVPTKCPHVEIQDFDNDGWPDVYFSAGWRDENGGITPLVFRNQGPAANGLPRFVPPREISGEMVYFPAGPTADFDRDGRIDLFLVNWFQRNHSRLLRNETGGRNQWLTVQVVGRRANRMGIGAKIRIYRAGKLGRKEALLGCQEINTGFGYASGQEAIAHFGLGKETIVDVEATLPDGTILAKPSIKGNQRLVLTEN
jgi:hypothetical protein